MINSLCFAILGCFIGHMMVCVHLDSFEAYRLLIIEKKTGVFTGTLNQRKLFETLDTLDTAGTEKPTGVLMIDSDHFKSFDDSHGHAAGGLCLERFGKVLIDFAQKFRLHFYRCGGEEFVAMAYGYDENELFSIAESLRIAVYVARHADRHTVYVEQIS